MAISFNVKNKLRILHINKWMMSIHAGIYMWHEGTKSWLAGKKNRSVGYIECVPFYCIQFIQLILIIPNSIKCWYHGECIHVHIVLTGVLCVIPCWLIVAFYIWIKLVGNDIFSGLYYIYNCNSRRTRQLYRGRGDSSVGGYTCLLKREGSFIHRLASPWL